MNPRITLLVTTLFAASVQAAPAWQTMGDNASLCGGVGDEEMQAIEAQKPAARLAVLMAVGSEGEFLSDVTLSIGGATLDTPMVLPSVGPLCLFKLPPGQYTVSGEHGGTTKRQDVTIGDTLQSIQLRFER